MATGKGNDGGRFGGYGQSGYDEDAANEPGVKADFDEEETREAVPGKTPRQGAEAQSADAKQSERSTNKGSSR
jgi:hypothetical protein